MCSLDEDGCLSLHSASSSCPFRPSLSSVTTLSRCPIPWHFSTPAYNFANCLSVTLSPSDFTWLGHLFPGRALTDTKVKTDLRCVMEKMTRFLPSSAFHGVMEIRQRSWGGGNRHIFVVVAVDYVSSCNPRRRELCLDTPANKTKFS